MEHNECFSPLKSLIARHYSFQNGTQFPQGNKLIDSPASNIDGFLSRDTFVSSTHLYRNIWNTLSISPA
jgi:hypothetical protein